MTTRFVFALIFALFCFGGSARADEVRESNCIVAESGDTLWGAAKILGSTVSDLAKGNGIKNPNRIYPGQKVCRDAEVKNPAKGSEIPQKEQPVKPIAPKTMETDVAGTQGYTPYAEAGRNPLVPKSDQHPEVLTQIEKDALLHIGVSGNDIALIEQVLSKGRVETVSLSPGTKFVAMSERGKGKSVKISYKRVATWKASEPATVFTLSDGRKVARINSCSNWTLLEQELKETPEDMAIMAVAPEQEQKPEAEGCGFDDHDLFLSRGGSKGNGSRVTYNYADGFVCLAKTRVDGGTVSAGVGGLYGNDRGSADDGFGFKGHRHGVGPAVKYYDDDGWDARLEFLFGRAANSGHSADGSYRQKRNFHSFGPAFGINLYQRELAGETWFPKTQIWGSAFKLSGASLNHSWQGTPIDDTGSLKSSWLISAGVRQFVYQGPVKPWVSAEFFGELPMTRNGTLMLGVTDEDEILWAGIGKTWNLKSGGSARSWMIGLDVGNLGRKLRGNYRHEEWVSTNTSYYDRNTGAFTLKKSEGNEVSSPVERATSSQQEAVWTGWNG